MNTLLPIRPVTCTAATQLAAAAAHAAEKRAELHGWPGRESVILDGLHALDAIRDAISALQRARVEITNTPADLGIIATLLHDAASEIAGHYKRAAEETAR